ncbi:MAG: hydroxyisourate hydrolase [Terracidiphilus sp.]|jgi:5-hydroxyisourate hydrolase
MSAITTHVLDLALGRPAAGVSVRLEQQESGAWTAVASGVTDSDGRCGSLKQDAAEGIYRLTFNTGDYLRRQGRMSIYPEVSTIFICSGEGNYHLPLLLSDQGYTTYRGS